MPLSAETQKFITDHLNEDPEKLLLAASRFPQLDMPFIADQILARRQIKEKLPSWYAHTGLIFPSRLSAEQCSSEMTALYKQQLIRGKKVCDLTGGLGVDSFFLAQKAEQLFYIERFPEYCKAAQHNFQLLKASNIQVIQGDAGELAQRIQADTFYLDPARRSQNNQRVFALTDCEPDILRLKTLLLERAQRLLLKISPMADIEETLRLLPETREIHILAVKNECKELLFVLEPHPLENPFSAVPVHAVQLPHSDFVFTLQQEKEVAPCLAANPGHYLYEPHAALLKSGAFKLISQRYPVQKLHPHSHLYTSETLYSTFPGRTFRIDQCLEFSSKLLRQLGKQLPKANLTTRNFPLSVAEIRKRSNIKEGGDIYLFATTLANGHRVILQCHKKL